MCGRLFVNQEDGGDFAEVGELRVLPFRDAEGADVFVGGCDAGGYAEACLRTEGREERLEHLLIAVGCFDEELRLAFRPGSCLEDFQALGSVGRLYGQVAVEGEALSVESACHHSHNHAAWPYERHNPQAFPLGDADDVCPWVGNSWAACLANDAYWFPFPQRLQILAKELLVRVFTHLEERAVVDGELPIHLPQETPRRTDVLHNEVPDAHDDLAVVRRQDLLHRRLAKGYRNKV